MVGHAAKLVAPWYADSRDGTVLHRYWKEDFIESYLNESQQGALRGNAHQAWVQQDKFGGDTTVLRLPVHRSFYVVSTELACDTPWKPAFAPRKIINAGFVVRKKVGKDIQIWRVRDGVGLGWHTPTALDFTQDPDQVRRINLNPELRIKNFNKPQVKTTGYTGEQTYPLHVQVAPEESRPHTLLYGFLPLSGSAEGREVATTEAPEAKSWSLGKPSQKDQPLVSAAGFLAELEWPFGSWDGVSAQATCNCSGTMQEIIQKLCEHFKWSNTFEEQVIGGQTTRAFARWLDLLVSRYQIFDESISDNEQLRNLLIQIPIFDRPLNAAQRDSMRSNPALFAQTVVNQRLSSRNLWHYLQHDYEDFLNWFSAQTNVYAKADAVPARWPSAQSLSGVVYITEAVAESIRGLMLLRAERASAVVESSLPLPRYTQGKDERYFVLPFVRYRADDGCEKLVWGEQSMEFKVASPFDPQATRPTVIQLPELKDIKKGFANGVTFLTPKSIAESMLKIAPDMDMKEKPFKSPLDACLGFSISFNIPIITICAMILLMIVLNLLNLIFRWLPYAILVLPRLCMPKSPGS